MKNRKYSVIPRLRSSRGNPRRMRGIAASDIRSPRNDRKNRPGGWFAMTAVIVLLLSCILPVSAADGKVSYSGNAGSIVFEPGSEHSLTDLFPDFKDVMPGDTLTQKITLKNNADNKVKVKIYIRALGAQQDSVEFLSQLGLKVAKSDDNEMGYMFDAAASETAQLTDRVYLGLLYSGGEVNLDVTLNVPVALPNEYQDKIGRLDWEFQIEELPEEPKDPKPPKTGDDTPVDLWLGLMLSSGTMLIIIFIWRKMDKKKSEYAPRH